MFAKWLVFAPAVLLAQWTPELSMKVKTVTAAVPSPDGKLAVWTETHPVMEGEKSESNAQVYLAHSDGSNRIQLTRGEKSSNAPAFSPDSQWVFFASDRSGKRNVYRIPVDGGEAEMVTNWTGTLGFFSISPNGKWIAFAAREQDNEEERAKREKRDFRVLDENPHNQSLWLIPVEPDVNGKRAAKRITNGPYNVGQFDWSPNSARIAYETRPTPDADDGRKSDILEVEIETGEVRNIAVTPAAEGQPRYSPDGRYLAFVRSNQSARRIDGNHIVLLALADLKTRDLPSTPDESPSLDSWARDSSRIYFSEGLHTREALYAMPVDGPATIVFQRTRGTFGPAVIFNRTGTYAGTTMQSPDEPVEAYVMQVSSMKPVRVSAANVDLPKQPIGETRVI
jgi:Tol biopolymer transport system component